MNKLVKIPAKLNPYLANFSDLFTKPSFISFSHMTTAVAICNKSKTIFNLHETMANDYKEKKARSSYNWFITNGDWDEDEIAQRKADLFFEELNIKEGDRILLIIDDTYKEKKGKKTEGVGKFFDHSKGYIWGNSFVTSVLQTKGLFIPHKAKMYIKKETEGSDFKTKIQIAIEDIIQPLRIPERTKLMIVFDSWWYSSTLIKSCCERECHVTCQIKSNKKIFFNNDNDNDNDVPLQAKSLAKRFDESDYKELKIQVRGKKKSYFIIEQMVRLDKIRQARLVISKDNLSKDAKPKYYICTDIDLSSKEILSIYEDRWDIETTHREANHKLGFKDYQLRSKHAIERFIQLVFAIWTGILLVEIENPPSDPIKRTRKKTIGELVDQVRAESILDLMVNVMENFNLPIPDEGGLLYKLKAIGLKVGK
jgi:hypothetical protein